MNKTELIAAMAATSNLSKKDCEAALTAFITANPDSRLEAAAAAVAAMGLAGEIGWSHMQEFEGNSTYRNRIIDAICNMTGDILNQGAKYEVR